jgi:hypothetical protein
MKNFNKSELNPPCGCILNMNCTLHKAAPYMYEALKEAYKLIELARQFFPKSIRNHNRFQLETTCATIGKTIAKAEGKC